jgi:4-hydroxythreonine-4-phosphate dehydrogenase
MPLPLALTIGEPAGVGPDISLFAWLRRNDAEIPAFYLIADPGFVARRARHLGVDVPLAEVSPEQAGRAFPDRLPIVPLETRITALPAHPDDTSAPAAIAAIGKGVADVFAGRAAAIVTNPVAKAILYRAGFPDPGHTEYLGRLAAAKTGKSAHPVMMIWATELAVVPVTVHLPLSEVTAGLSTGLIVKTVRVVARDLKERFGIAHPRLAVAGLNPHAGEDGALGGDDLAVIAPAIAQLVAEGIDAHGPHPADTMVHAAARRTYDVAICMYHDQALIPIKTLAFERAVNVTLGLPFVRTSPDHGTAFAVAGSHRADPTSLIEALRLAARLAAAESPVPAPALSRA